MVSRLWGKLLIMTIFGMCFVNFVGADVIINEVMYDAVASDEGQEWIELYNNSNQDVCLENWRIESGGTSYATTFVFPRITIRSKAFFLISEDFNSGANLITSLDFQNAGGATDAIRIVSSSGQYKDTVLYGSPNSNDLQGDIEGQESLDEVTAGNSLARLYDGLDSNQTSDWTECLYPTPGYSNIVIPQVTIEDVKIEYDSGSTKISTLIRNLSTCCVNNSSIILKITVNGELEDENSVCEILPDSLVIVCTVINKELINGDCLEVEIYSQDEIDIVDNLWTEWISIQSLECILSEVMFKPLANNSEWIEIFLQNKVEDVQVGIEDASGNSMEVSFSGESGEYIVFAENKTELCGQFPLIDSSLVVEPSTWVQLNNSGDQVILKFAGTVVDSVAFNSSSTKQGYSWEKNFESGLWQEHQSSFGGSPTEAFSTVIIDDDSDFGVAIVSNLISTRKSSIFQVNYNSPTFIEKIELLIYDLRGKQRARIIEDDIGNNSGEFSWDGKLKGKSLAKGIYPCKLKILNANNNFLIDKQVLISINE